MLLTLPKLKSARLATCIVVHYKQGRFWVFFFFCMTYPMMLQDAALYHLCDDCHSGCIGYYKFYTTHPGRGWCPSQRCPGEPYCLWPVTQRREPNMYSSKCGYSARVVSRDLLTEITVQSLTREQGSLSLIERKKYTNAMLCLMSKPPKLASTDAPGIRNRFDDFVSVHIRQTPAIHATVRPHRMHPYRHSINKTGQFPNMAPLLHLSIRASPPQRVWLRWLSTLLGME